MVAYLVPEALIIPFFKDRWSDLENGMPPLIPKGRDFSTHHKAWFLRLKDWIRLSTQGVGYYCWQMARLIQARMLIRIYTPGVSKFPQFRDSFL